MRNKKLMIIFSVICAIALVSVLTSVMFSVRHVYAHCENADDEELAQRVIDNSGIQMGQSIFLLDKNQVIQNLKTTVTNIVDVSVEKKFPNIVYINYTKAEEYYKIYSNSKIYLLTKYGVTTRILQEDEPIKDGLISIKLYGQVISGLGEQVKSDNDEDVAIMTAILPALESLELLLENEPLGNFIEFIDFTKGSIFIKTKAGMYWEMLSFNNAQFKLSLAFAAYKELRSESSMVKEGTLIISSSRADYTAEDRYNS